MWTKEQFFSLTFSELNDLAGRMAEREEFRRGHGRAPSLPKEVSDRLGDLPPEISSVHIVRCLHTNAPMAVWYENYKNILPPAAVQAGWRWVEDVRGFIAAGVELKQPQTQAEAEELAQQLFQAGWRLNGWGLALTDTDNETGLSAPGGLFGGHWADGESRSTEEAYGHLGIDPEAPCGGEVLDKLCDLTEGREEGEQREEKIIFTLFAFLSVDRRRVVLEQLSQMLSSDGSS